MRRMFALLLSVMMIGVGVPLAPTMSVTIEAAVQPPGGTISGTANQGGKAVEKVTMRLVDAQGNVVQTQVTQVGGQFSFSGLNAGQYAVQMVDAAGNVLGSTGMMSLAAGQVITGVTVSAAAAAAAAGAAAAAAAAGGGFFTTTAGILVIAAVGAGVTAGIVAALPPASPSR